MPAPLVLQPQTSKAQLTDEYYRLDQAVKAFSPKLKRHAELASLIRSWYEDLPADQGATAEGIESRVLVGERTEQRRLGLYAKLKIYTLVGGKKAFAELADLTLKAAIAAVGQERVDALATKEQTGSRKLVALAKASIETLKAA